MEQIIHIITEMAPYLLLGFLFAGILHVFVPARFYTHYLADNSFRSVIYATLLGIPLPLCSCGVLPTALSLHKEGGSRGATTAFLIATPQTGVDSILATLSLMGLPLAVIRPLAALVTALCGGQVANWLAKKEKAVEADRRLEASAPTEEHHCCCCHEEDDQRLEASATTEEHHCCCCHEEDDRRLEASAPTEEHACCCCHEEEKHAGESPALPRWGRQIGRALRYAYVDMIGDIGGWLVLGLVIAALITIFVPNDFFAIFAGNTWLSMLLVLAISVPMYICATGSIPIAVALMLKGLSPGTAFVMLMAGPACNIASILLIRKRLGTRTLAAYLGSIIAGALLTGIVIDTLLPAEWFRVSATTADCCDDSASWFQIACAVILLLLLLAAYMRRLSGKKKTCGCH